MEVIITLITANEESHNVTLEIPGGEICLDQLVTPFQVLYDQIIKLETMGKHITCKKGCSACCVQMIPLSIPEVFYFDMKIRTLPAAHKKRIKKRFARNKNKLNSLRLLKDLKDPQKVRTLDKVYFHLGLECPFLESGICSIYHDRPFVCREYYVISSQELCRSPYTSPIKKIKIDLNIGALLSSFTARLLGLASTPVPHIIIPDWADRFRDLEKKRYSAHWMIEEMLHVFSTVKPEQGNIKQVRIS